MRNFHNKNEWILKPTLNIRTGRIENLGWPAKNKDVELEYFLRKLRFVEKANPLSNGEWERIATHLQRVSYKNSRNVVVRAYLDAPRDKDGAVVPEVVAEVETLQALGLDTQSPAARHMVAANQLFGASVGRLHGYVQQDRQFRRQLQSGDGTAIRFPETLVGGTTRIEVALAQTYEGNTHLDVQPLHPDGSPDSQEGFSLVKGSDNNTVMHRFGHATPIHDPAYGQEITMAGQALDAYLDGIQAPPVAISPLADAPVPAMIETAITYDTTSARLRRAATRFIDRIAGEPDSTTF